MSPQSVIACMDKHHSTDEYFQVISCEPLGASQRIKGTWFVGFEASRFRESYLGVPAEAGPRSGQLELIARKTLAARVHLNDSIGPRAYQIEFSGRKSRLGLAGDRGRIVLDHLFEMRAVPLAPGELTSVHETKSRFHK